MRRLAISAVFLGFIMAAAIAAEKVATRESDAELAKRMEEAVKLGKDTAIQEYLNGRWEAIPKAVAALTATQPAAGELEKAREVAQNVATMWDKCKDWPKPPSFTASRAKGPIAIDGKLDEKDWAAARPTGPFYELNSLKPEPAEKVAFKMLWDEKNVYFAFQVQDDTITAPKLPRDSNVFLNDCVELFIMPSMRWKVYWELEINPAGSVFDSLMHKYYRGNFSYSRLDETIEGLQYAITMTGPADKPTGYIIEIAVPADQLPGMCTPLKAGQTFYLMAVAEDKAGEVLKVYNFVPTVSWNHNVWCYAPVTLAE